MNEHLLAINSNDGVQVPVREDRAVGRIIPWNQKQDHQKAYACHEQKQSSSRTSAPIQTSQEALLLSQPWISSP